MNRRTLLHAIWSAFVPWKAPCPLNDDLPGVLSSTLHGTIVIPSDGDPAIADSVVEALRGLREHTVYFGDHMHGREKGAVG